ncbi:flagellar motor switch protein FliM [Desulfolucanica intricata]|uniref:flagellar motor switch protein FliM n=1 Tax=Desulfolucanica intricata TaxID=1285191 RepID=UPI00083535B2|nr:flagellar motor switch protein FliM [Desulfolucanica intricata]
MKEVLSRAEIGSLLQTIQVKKEEDKDLKKTEIEVKYKTYDFKRPNKFSNDQLRTLHMLHEGYARLLSNFLSGYLRTNIVVRVASVDQFTFDDFLRSVHSPTLLSVFLLQPLKGTAILETNPQFIFPVIDLMLGGRGEMTDPLRELTEIELSVMKKLNVKLLENLGFIWKDFFEVTPELLTVETNPRLHQIISPSEIVAVLTFNTVIGGTIEGFINICLPYMLLDPVLSQLSLHYRYSRNTAADQDDRTSLEYWLGLSEISLTAVLGETEISVRDFLHLQEGDVLSLDRRIGEDMDLYVDEKLKYKVQTGIMGRFFAVQVTSLTEGERTGG